MMPSITPEELFSLEKESKRLSTVTHTRPLRKKIKKVKRSRGREETSAKGQEGVTPVVPVTPVVHVTPVDPNAAPQQKKPLTTREKLRNLAALEAGAFLGEYEHSQERYATWPSSYARFRGGPYGDAE